MNRISFLNRGYAFKGLLAVFRHKQPVRINYVMMYPVDHDLGVSL